MVTSSYAIALMLLSEAGPILTDETIRVVGKGAGLSGKGGEAALEVEW
jgi:hypothetical protein